MEVSGGDLGAAFGCALGVGASIFVPRCGGQWLTKPRYSPWASSGCRAGRGGARGASTGGACSASLIFRFSAGMSGLTPGRFLGSGEGDAARLPEWRPRSACGGGEERCLLFALLRRRLEVSEE